MHRLKGLSYRQIEDEPLCAVLDLLAAGRLPQAGFVRQEDVDFCDFVTNRFGRHFLTDSEEVRCAASGVLAGPPAGV